jgi:nucleotide-binding universal stress UspA family protein
MAEHLILALDDSAGSDAAVDWVISRSDTHELDLELTIVKEVLRMPHGGRMPLSSTPYEEYLHRVAARITASRPLLATRLVVREGHPARALIAASDRTGLIVLGSSHPGALVGLVNGTVPLQVAGRSRCPVVVVPAGNATPSGRVVCGWADDGTADAAVEFAAREARSADEPLHLVHVWRVPVLGGAAVPPLGAAGFALDEVAAQAAASVEEAARSVRAAHPGLVVTTEVVTGSAATAIADAGRDASLVVVGSHGRSALGGLLLGSVSHDVLLALPAPVAVVPGPEPITVLPEILDEDL